MAYWSSHVYLPSIIPDIQTACLKQGSRTMLHTCAPWYVTIILREGATCLGLVSEPVLATLFVMAAAGLRPTLSTRLGWRSELTVHGNTELQIEYLLCKPPI